MSLGCCPVFLGRIRRSVRTWPGGSELGGSALEVQVSQDGLSGRGVAGRPGTQASSAGGPLCIRQAARGRRGTGPAPRACWGRPQPSPPGSHCPAPALEPQGTQEASSPSPLPLQPSGNLGLTKACPGQRLASREARGGELAVGLGKLSLEPGLQEGRRPSAGRGTPAGSGSLWMTPCGVSVGSPAGGRWGPFGWAGGGIGNRSPGRGQRRW